MQVFKTNMQRYFMLCLIALVLCLFIMNRCGSTTSDAKPPKVTIVRDTVWQTKIDTFKIQTVQYKTVYIEKERPENIVEDLAEVPDRSAFKPVNRYQDTLRNEDIEIYTESLIDGHMLNSELSYKLKVPREITITKTIEHPKSYKSGLYLFSEVGGNAQQFDNLSLGLQYQRKGQWTLSYRLNLNPGGQPTHNVGFGWRLF